VIAQIFEHMQRPRISNWRSKEIAKILLTYLRKQEWVRLNSWDSKECCA